MRLWEYDRVGGIASEQFDINDSENPLEFVATMLGFLWTDDERLGFDPTILSGTPTASVLSRSKRNSRLERLVIDEAVRIRDADDAIRNSVRTGLDVITVVAPIATVDAMTTCITPNSTVMANTAAKATTDSTAITALMGNAPADNVEAPTTTMAQRASRHPSLGLPP
ncbi:hypothetical protein THAR02_06138 [Trichoderma harzianum]|uniref:Fungal-type protein kinase domain-containing protein n=1 Tax=Trichoderma harzianum TaxID=5544 RepID=A0A0G0A9M7_TRIHA|nr:hypothetical protein THAR02_06138 [Trichoderma harzianum]